ncbi:hypothetical protein PCURB6_37780 [Paenibacillus curdlanolyticus]|nr:hypothetical protein PCURB6_37780 [Paenibacillus curdlanolyticus]
MWAVRNSLRVARIAIIVLLCLASISITIQIHEDYKTYQSNAIIADTIVVTSFTLSDGARISNSVLPYQIYTDHDDGAYYLYRKLKLHKQTAYSVKYFINHSNEKIILDIRPV